MLDILCLIYIIFLWQMKRQSTWMANFAAQPDRRDSRVIPCNCLSIPLDSDSFPFKSDTDALKHTSSILNLFPFFANASLIHTRGILRKKKTKKQTSL